MVCLLEHAAGVCVCVCAAVCVRPIARFKENVCAIMCALRMFVRVSHKHSVACAGQEALTLVSKNKTISVFEISQTSFLGTVVK